MYFCYLENVLFIRMTSIGFDDDYFMREALKQAYLAYDEGEIPVGAVMVCDGRILAKGYNMTEKLKDVTAHAEMLVITSASNHIGGKYLTECALYVTVEPCVMCAGATQWTQIGKIVYGATDEKRGFTKYSKKILHPKTKIVTGILEKECKELMVRFFEMRR